MISNIHPKLLPCNIIRDPFVADSSHLWSNAKFLQFKNTIVIGKYAIACCFYLLNIDLGNVCDIQEGAFFSNLNLKCVMFPDSVTNIRSKAFSQCKSLQYVSISERTIVDVSAFDECHSQLIIHIRQKCDLPIMETVMCKAYLQYVKKFHVTVQIEKTLRKYSVYIRSQAVSYRHLIKYIEVFFSKVYNFNGLKSIQNGIFIFEYFYIDDKLKLHKNIHKNSI